MWTATGNGTDFVWLWTLHICFFGDNEDGNLEKNSLVHAFAKSQCRHHFFELFLSFLADSHHAAGSSTRMSLFILLAIFTCSASIMYLVYRNFPELTEWVTLGYIGNPSRFAVLSVVLCCCLCLYYVNILTGNVAHVCSFIWSGWPRWGQSNCFFQQNVKGTV